jgi:hypothetical protein
MADPVLRARQLPGGERVPLLFTAKELEARSVSLPCTHHLHNQPTPADLKRESLGLCKWPRFACFHSRPVQVAAICMFSLTQGLAAGGSFSGGNKIIPGTELEGVFTVPSYRSGLFLDPKVPPPTHIPPGPRPWSYSEYTIDQDYTTPRPSLLVLSAPPFVPLPPFFKLRQPPHNLQTAQLTPTHYPQHQQRQQRHKPATPRPAPQT